MPESRIVPSKRLKPLIVYFAVAFVVVLAVGLSVPAGPVRVGLVLGWIVVFPMGAWWVFRATKQ